MTIRKILITYMFYIVFLLDSSDLENIIWVKISKLQNDRYNMKEPINTTKHAKKY